MWKTDSDTWKAVGDLWFRAFRAGQEPLDDYRFWCSRCRLEFPSMTTPTKCPNGCKADDMDDRVELTHKGYTAATFPFAVSQPIRRN